MPNGSKIDFKFSRGDDTIFVEATSANRSAEQVDRDEKEHSLISALKSDRHPRWRVWIKRLRLGEQHLDWGACVSEVIDWLDSLGAVAGAKQFAWDDWKVTLVPLEEPNSRYLWSGGPMRSGPTSERPILFKILEKADKYGPLDAPYLIAILVSDLSKGFDEMVEDALFGPLTIRIDAKTKKAMGVSRNGKLFNEHPNISALVVADMLHPENYGTYVPHLWLNPGATYPLPSLDPIPWTVSQVLDGYLKTDEGDTGAVTAFFSRSPDITE